MDISIIIPTFNRLWCLPQAVESCRTRDCRCEIIVVDDGSTDGTWEWLQQQTDLVSIRQENWGKDAAVNNGFRSARGEYIRFLDSDDFLLPHSNERQVELARCHDADVVVSGFRMLNEENSAQVDVPWIFNDDFISQQLGETRSCHYSGFIFKRSFISDITHKQEFGPVDDRMFVIEVALKSPVVAIDDDLAFVQRDHRRNRLTNARNLNSLVGTWQHLRVYKQAYKMLEARDQVSERRKKAISQIMWHVAHKIAAWSINDASEVMQWIHNLDPNFTPPVDGFLGLSNRILGFEHSERLIRVVRGVRYPFRLLRKNVSVL